MRRLIFASLLVIVLSVLSVSAAYGVASGPADLDTWVNVNSPTTAYGTDVHLWTRGDTNVCNTSWRTYLKWDLSDIANPGDIANAQLKLWVNGSTGDWTSTRTVSLFQVTDDSWTNATTWSTSPPPGTLIQTVGKSDPLDGAISNEYLTFSGANLVSYLQAQAAGDDVASFAVVMTGDCTAGTVGLRFDSIDKAGGIPPTLEITNPNSVTLRAMDSDGTSARVWILAGVALLLGAGVIALSVIRRRRTAN
ncbi:MAG: DNRLRE domain-containing protein [Caldilineales bacterium]|nr:DNRLRE domain-containing protein [Caldilineales bacterium]MDW8317973.1 DNRLRE domain-containing protein [Anaerolineae bacterium]